MRSTDCELTNMVRISDPSSGKSVFIRRRLSWTGLSFPGGHVEKGESIYDSAMREAKEETGLTLRSLEPCGVVDWCHKETGRRYLVFLFESDDFTGTLKPSTEEGDVFWAAVDEIKNERFSPHFDEYLKIFFDEKIAECFGLHDDETDDEMIFLP